MRSPYLFVVTPARRALLVAVVMTLALAACTGGDDDAESTTATDEAAEEEAATVEGDGAAVDDGSSASDADGSVTGDDETALDLSGGEGEEGGDEGAAAPDGEGDGAGATESGGEDGDDSDPGRGGGDDSGSCVGTWFLDQQALGASLESVLAAQGVTTQFFVTGGGTLEIRDDGFATVQYDEVVMQGQIEGGSLEVTLTWAATGFIEDQTLALEGFEEPTVDAAMFIAGERFDMNDLVADLDLTAGFASVDPVAVECADGAVELVPDDPVWTLRFS